VDQAHAWTEGGVKVVVEDAPVDEQVGKWEQEVL